MAADYPIQQRSDNDGTHERACVVHVASSDGKHCREGHPYNNVQQVCECEYIGGDAVAAELEWPIRYGFSTELLQQEEKDRRDVRDA